MVLRIYASVTRVFSRVCLHFLLVKLLNFVNVQTNMF